MGTAAELGLKKGDIATFVTVSARGQDSHWDGLSIVPDRRWSEARFATGSEPTYKVTVGEVAKVSERGTTLKVLASTDPGYKNGEFTRIPNPGFNRFVGGENDRTHQELDRAGVEIRPHRNGKGKITRVEVIVAERLEVPRAPAFPILFE